MGKEPGLHEAVTIDDAKYMGKRRFLESVMPDS